MDRRRFLQLAALPLAAQQKPPVESVTATATQDRTPRVAIILSSFRGSMEHHGTLLPGLLDPQPVTTPLSPEHLDAMLRKAIELGTTRAGGLPSIIGPEDWVVIQHDAISDPRLIRGLKAFLEAQRLGKRFTVAGPMELDGAETQEMPVPGGERVYRIPKLLLQCDCLLRVAALLADTFRHPGTPDLAVVDRMSFHPPDYTILAGRNILVAGADPLAVDSVGARILGLDPTNLPYLRLAADRGLGVWEPGAIWTRGNKIEEARKELAT